ncbi:helix-turn-helix transcriptional regulator [Streptomyces sp. NPDC052309]|uniref:helix-turn-helix domain-containing protein n=1 Tax=Streptomyces sp. NPDC052309 TaxID=3155421 RepID=UPI0034240629
MAGDDFAGLLREMKERSGLSYGALGKRLHISASTLHRYVKGEVVPTEFAPVERLARLCRATPEELLELHRRWIRADALRGVKPGKSAEPEKGEAAEKDAEAPEAVAEAPEAEAPGDAERADGPAAAAEPASAPAPAASAADGRDDADPAAAAAPAATPRTDADDTPLVTATARRPRPRPRHRRMALYAATGVAVAAAVGLVVNLIPDGESGGRDMPAKAAGVTASPSPSASASRPTGSASPTGSGSASPSASASRTSTASPGPTQSRAADKPAGSAGRDGSGEGGGSVTVQTTPYYWDSPCDQSFLVDRSPRNVPPPPTTQRDAVGWATALGAVSADRQTVALTVQGTGPETVVLQALHVRVVGSDAPLTWDKYAVGVGCGGGVATKSFDVSLDLGNPLATPVNGQRNFPYKVSESDPEVFYVNAHTSGHDVRWYLELDWSSGSRHGTVRIDDSGRPFRTSASDTDYYGYMLGGTSWEHFDGT